MNARVSNQNKEKYLEDEVICEMCKELENEFRMKEGCLSGLQERNLLSGYDRG